MPLHCPHFPNLCIHNSQKCFKLSDKDIAQVFIEIDCLTLIMRHVRNHPEDVYNTWMREWSKAAESPDWTKEDEEVMEKLIEPQRRDLIDRIWETFYEEARKGIIGVENGWGESAQESLRPRNLYPSMFLGRDERRKARWTTWKIGVKSWARIFSCFGRRRGGKDLVDGEKASFEWDSDNE